MPRIAARALGTLALVAALVAAPDGAPLAQEAPAAPADSRTAMRNLALGLAALAAIGLALRAAEDDEEEEAEQRSRRLPAECLRDWPLREEAREGTVRLLDPDCLAERFARADELPLDCAVTLRVAGRFVSGFDPACLAEDGWRLGRRRSD